MRSALGSLPKAPSAHLDIHEWIMGGHKSAVVVAAEAERGGTRLSKSGNEASTSWICGRVIREGLMARMSVTAAALCWFWFWDACIGEAHLVLLLLKLVEDALPAEALLALVIDAGRAGRSA